MSASLLALFWVHRSVDLRLRPRGQADAYLRWDRPDDRRLVAQFVDADRGRYRRASARA